MQDEDELPEEGNGDPPSQNTLLITFSKNLGLSIVNT